MAGPKRSSARPTDQPTKSTGLFFRSISVPLCSLLVLATARCLEMRMGFLQTLASKLPEYNYSIPGTTLYFMDATNLALGYKVRNKLFWDQNDLPVDMKGKDVLVTGGNAGIGRTTAETLAAMGANVHILCRSREKGEKAVQEIKASTGNADVHLHICDMSSQAQIRDFVGKFSVNPGSLHVLVNNVAIMLDHGARSFTPEGYETALATNLLGFHALTTGLIPVLKRSSGARRIVNVVSAGMLTQQLKINTFLEKTGPYDGAMAYSQHHRARVMLTEVWAKELQADGITVNSVHPGWVDTPGLQNAGPMQVFYRKTREWLRTPQQGADTVVWLAAAKRAGDFTGRYFFDRAPRRTSMPFANTIPTAEQYDQLVAFCKESTSGRKEG